MRWLGREMNGSNIRRRRKVVTIRMRSVVVRKLMIMGRTLMDRKMTRYKQKSTRVSNHKIVPFSSHQILVISTELATYVLLHFEVDGTVCALPVKCIVHPALPELVVGCSYRVRWSKRKQYDISVLCLGRTLIQ